MNDELRYPIGRFEPPEASTPEDRQEWIRQIDGLPDQLEAAVGSLSDEQLDTPYRTGGWTVRQVAHHVADSHMNAYVRVRLALTENAPIIKPYDEGAWANLADAASSPVEPSLMVLRGLHERWVRLFSSLHASDWDRSYDHPDSGPTPLDEALAHYAWHGQHHLAHITTLRERSGW